MKWSSPPNKAISHHIDVFDSDPPILTNLYPIQHSTTHLASAFSAQPYQLARRTLPPPLPGTMAMRIPAPVLLFPSAMAPRRARVVWRPAA